MVFLPSTFTWAAEFTQMRAKDNVFEVRAAKSSPSSLFIDLSVRTKGKAFEKYTLQ